MRATTFRKLFLCFLSFCAFCVPSSIEEGATPERERGQTATTKHQELILSGRLSGHHLNRSCTLLIRERVSIRDCRFQTHATRLECLKLRLHSVSLDRQLAAALFA